MVAMKRLSIVHYGIVVVMLGMVKTTGAEFFAHDRAAWAVQKGELEPARHLLQKALVDDPHDPEILYDLGVVASMQGEHDKGAAYFEAVTRSALAPALLKEQAHFNLGNSYVALNKLQKAIEQYEQVLALNPANEQARYNLEQVKKMLKEQEKKQQEQEKKQQEQEKKQQQKQEQEQQEQQDQQKDSQSPDQQQDQSQHEPSQDKNREEDKSPNQSGQQQQKQQQDAHQPTHDQSNQEEKAKQGDKRDQQQQHTKEKTSKQNAQETQQSTDEQQTGAQHHPEKRDAAKQQQLRGGQSGKDQEAPKKDDAQEQQQDWLATLLKQAEEGDAQGNKQMLRATLKNSEGTGNDQLGW
jgi:tetratricopeptide (TPR) repeat protein